MKVGLIGFGKTGKAVASVLLQSPETNLQWVVRQSHTLEHRSVPEFFGITSKEPGLIYSIEEYSAADLIRRMPVDVIIDFSSTEGIKYYGHAAAEQGVALVSAISAYPAYKTELLQQLSLKTRVLWSPNITIGINFLIIAAKILKNIAPYTDIEIIEEHFKAKPEISGTAKKIAEALMLPEDEIKMVRAGGIIGVHEILFGFPYQTVRLRHESISREAFGNGVLFAAQHLLDKPNGLYTMEDLLIPYFQLNADLPEGAGIHP